MEETRDKDEADEDEEADDAEEEEADEEAEEEVDDAEEEEIETSVSSSAETPVNMALSVFLWPISVRCTNLFLLWPLKPKAEPGADGEQKGDRASLLTSRSSENNPPSPAAEISQQDDSPGGDKTGKEAGDANGDAEVPSDSQSGSSRKVRSKQRVLTHGAHERSLKVLFLGFSCLSSGGCLRPGPSRRMSPQQRA